MPSFRHTVSKAIKSCLKQTSDHRNGFEIFSTNPLCRFLAIIITITIQMFEFTIEIWSESFLSIVTLWWEFLWGNDVLSTYTGDQGLNLLFFNYSCLKSNLVTVNKYQFPRITWHSPAKNYYICPSTLNTLENVKCLLCSKWGEILFCPNHLFCWWIIFQ